MFVNTVCGSIAHGDSSIAGSAGIKARAPVVQMKDNKLRNCQRVRIVSSLVQLICISRRGKVCVESFTWNRHGKFRLTFLSADVSEREESYTRGVSSSSIF
jgi:hypothetical protein